MKFTDTLHEIRQLPETPGGLDVAQAKLDWLHWREHNPGKTWQDLVSETRDHLVESGTIVQPDSPASTQ
jgi:hypothetical protein